MEDLSRQHLNETLCSNGWLIVRKKFDDKVKELDSIDSIDETQSSELQVAAIISNKKAKKIIQDVFSELQTMANLNKVIKKSML